MFVQQIRTPFLILLFLNPPSSYLSPSLSTPLCSKSTFAFATHNAPHKSHIETHYKSKPAHHKMHQEADRERKSCQWTSTSRTKHHRWVNFGVSFIVEPWTRPMSTAWQQELTNGETALPKLKGQAPEPRLPMKLDKHENSLTCGWDVSWESQAGASARTRLCKNEQAGATVQRMDEPWSFPGHAG